MRRIDRRRSERLRRLLLTTGLSFALGALSALGLSWRVEQTFDADAPAAAPIISAAPTTSTQPEVVDAAQQTRPAPRAETREPRPTATTGVTNPSRAIDELRDRKLLVPVEGVDRKELHDTYTEARGSRTHEALDIMAPRQTPVRAVENGRIAKLFTSKAGGLTIYMFDPSETYCYYYAHLDHYAKDVHEGQQVHRGDVIGYVGTTGNAAENAPHLHFGIFRLTAERQWWKGDPINPYPVLAR